MTLGSLYIEAQGYIPVLLENLRGMSCSGTCWPLGGAWFQCRYEGYCCVRGAFPYSGSLWFLLIVKVLHCMWSWTRGLSRFPGYCVLVGGAGFLLTGVQ